MLHDIQEVEIGIFSEIWVIRKLQYTKIYSKLNRRNKLCSKDKFDDNNLDDEANNSYLCNGNNN